MLKLVISAKELYDSKTNEFKTTQEKVICLEHSLVSVAKWESKWHIPFFSKKEKTQEQLLDYIKCMTLTQNVEDEIYYSIDDKEMLKIKEYMEDPMTATTFNIREDPSKGVHRVNEYTTNELIYYWMLECNIPFSPCEKWNINRLFTLIRVCNTKQNPGKKMSNKEIFKNNRALNAANRMKYHSRG